MHVKDADPGCSSGCCRDRGTDLHEGRITARVPVLLAHRHPAHLQGDPQLVRRGRADQGSDGRAEPTRSAGCPTTWEPTGSATGSRMPATGRSVGTDIWGTTIPVWECDACDEQVCVGSFDELEALSGVRPDDLHKHILDPITWPCASNCEGNDDRRVPEVLDTWYDSGSMPFAQNHYPFDERGAVRGDVPGELHRRRPRPDPGLVLHPPRALHGHLRHRTVPELRRDRDDPCRGRAQDVEEPRQLPRPCRTSSTNSAPTPCAPTSSTRPCFAPTRFASERMGVSEVVRTVLFPLWNAYSFFTTYAEADRITGAGPCRSASR